MFSGKCLAGDTPVLMANGDLRPAEDIAEGDLLLAPATGGTCGGRPWSTVVGVSWGLGGLWRVSFSRGAPLIVSEDHLVPATVITQAGMPYLANWGLRALQSKLQRPDVLCIEAVADGGGEDETPLITAVEPIGCGIHYGLSIDSPDKWMIVGKGIVTHNSSALVAAVERHNIAGKKCVIIRHAIDVRFEQPAADLPPIMTHRGDSVRGAIRVVAAIDLDDLHVDALVADADVVGIDEIQFFERADETIAIIDGWARKGRMVICAGLDGDYARRAFAYMSRLAPLCDRITKLVAVCMRCGADAPFTARNSAEIGDRVGGKDKYSALCRRCYAQFAL